MIPFRYQRQYEDSETGLYYNRFRYYSPDEGMYLSQDPIGLVGNNPTLYGYVKDVNGWVDVFGLAKIKDEYSSMNEYWIKKLQHKSLLVYEKRIPSQARYTRLGQLHDMQINDWEMTLRDTRHPDTASGNVPSGFESIPNKRFPPLATISARI